MSRENARYRCSECGDGLNEDWEIEFHQDIFGQDHIPIPTGEPVEVRR